jgi:hypothetical protein
MSFSAERLYELMPMIYRLRDGDHGEALKSLLGVIAEQAAGFEENLEQLYDDQFIETCADWVVPYIGELLGYQPVHAIKRLLANQRAEVANTIGYRRRKGTAAVLDQLARDVTGWPARAVEFFQRLQWHQHLNHQRRNHHGGLDLRDRLALEYRDTPFDKSNRTVDVRRMETDGGRFNIPNVGIFLWRLQVYGVRNAPAVGLDERRFFFSPWSINMQLATRPEAERAMAHLADPVETPMPISRTLLSDRLTDYYGSDKSVFVRVNNADIDIADIRVCSLEDRLPTGWAHLPDSGVAIDPELGRLALGTSFGSDPDVAVTYHDRFSEDMGGGDYERGHSFESDLTPSLSIHNDQTIQAGLNGLPGHGVLKIEDNGRYEEAPDVLAAAGECLEIRAMNERRPVCVLTGDFTISGDDNSCVILNGLWLGGGRLFVPAGSDLKKLVIRHCTVLPGLALGVDGEPQSASSPGVVVASPHTELIVEESIVGGIRLHQDGQAKLENSVIDATDERIVAYAHIDDDSAGGVLTMKNCSIIGKVHARRFEWVSNCIFDAALAAADPWQAAVMATQKQQGCVRFSYLPPGSRTPRRHRCQPELAIRQAWSAAEKDNPGIDAAQKSAIAAWIASRIHPIWTARRCGKPGYMQLAHACAEQIKTGADDESEMGVFHNLFQPQRQSNLRIRLQEYLRVGLEVGMIYLS